MSPLSEQFVAVVAKYLSDHKLSQRELAAKLGVSRSQVSDYLTGHNSPSLKTVDRWLSVIGYGATITKMKKRT